MLICRKADRALQGAAANQLPTNNDSERGFRFAVIQRKVSQCSKTADGADAFAAFASVIKTAMRQAKDVVERLTGLFRGIDPQSNPT